MRKIKIIFNDIALKYQIHNKFDVMNIFKKFTETFLEIERVTYKRKLSALLPFTGMKLCSDYYIEQLYNEPDLKIDIKRSILTVFTKIEIIDINIRSIFEFEQIKSNVCAVVINNNHIAISLDIDNALNKPFIEGNLINNEITIPNVKMPNLCEKEHVDIHKNLVGIRVYEESPKHKIGTGWGSPMDLDEATAQEVLNGAIEYRDNIDCLVNKYEDKYYIFRRHINNCYHGYIDDKVPQIIKNKFNLQ